MLKGKQKKLDVNKDGKISGDDFAMLKGKKMSDGVTEKGMGVEKKMGGGMMMQEPMGYKKGGGVRGGRAEMKGLRPAKMF